MCLLTIVGRFPLVYVVYGVLLGTQQGRDIEIQNSFEIRLDPPSSSSSAPTINHAFLKSRQSQYKLVFPTLDLLGWYTIGDVPTPQDLEIHKQLLAYNETPLLIQLHQTVASFENAEVNGELPIRVYETVVEIVQGETTNFFVPAGYKIETGEAERIAVDHASKAGAESGADNESSSKCFFILINLNLCTNAALSLNLHCRFPACSAGQYASATQRRWQTQRPHPTGAQLSTRRQEWRDSMGPRSIAADPDCCSESATGGPARASRRATTSEYKEDGRVVSVFWRSSIGRPSGTEMNRISYTRAALPEAGQDTTS